MSSIGLEMLAMEIIQPLLDGSCETVLFELGKNNCQPEIQLEYSYSLLRVDDSILCATAAFDPEPYRALEFIMSHRSFILSTNSVVPPTSSSLKMPSLTK